MTIPPFIVFACAVAVLLLIGGLIHTAYRLGVRVDALEAKESDLRGHVGRLEGILYRMNPDAFKSDE